MKNLKISERIKKHNAKYQRVKEFREGPTSWEVCANSRYRLSNNEIGINDPRALRIHKKIGEMIAVDSQLFAFS